MTWRRGILMPRRTLLGSVLGFALGWSRPGVAASEKLPPDTELSVSRKGKEIGRHIVTFDATDDGFNARTSVDLKVTVALVTAFSYQQEAVDHWVDSTLVRSIASCNENGEETKFEAWAEGDKLVFDGKAGRNALPLGAMTDLCFWNPNILATQRIIDAQTAEINPMQVDDLGLETIIVAGVEMQANRYYAASGETRHGDVWYDLSGRLAKAAFHTRGEFLEYELVS